MGEAAPERRFACDLCAKVIGKKRSHIIVNGVAVYCASCSFDIDRADSDLWTSATLAAARLILPVPIGDPFEPTAREKKRAELTEAAARVLIAKGDGPEYREALRAVLVALPYMPGEYERAMVRTPLPRTL